MFETNIVEKIKTHMLYSVTLFPEIVPLWCTVENYDTAR